MTTYALATDRPVAWAVLQGGTVIAAGQQPPNSVTFAANTNTIVSDASETAFLGKVAGKADGFNPLPPVGSPLQAGEIYGYNGGLVLVRQSHNRTADAPADVPALFSVYRANAGDVLDWVAGEPVIVGTRRLYGGKTWEAIQAHQTEFSPDLVPALWKEVVTGTVPQPWVQPTGAHDAYKKLDRVTYGGFTWESTIDANVWAPGVFGWVKV